MWNYREPTMITTTLSNNNATYYGVDIASFARELVKIEDSNVYLK